jgi:hypothetical protein
VSPREDRASTRARLPSTLEDSSTEQSGLSAHPMPQALGLPWPNFADSGAKTPKVLCRKFLGIRDAFSKRACSADLGYFQNKKSLWNWVPSCFCDAARARKKARPHHRVSGARVWTICRRRHKDQATRHDQDRPQHVDRFARRLRCRRSNHGQSIVVWAIGEGSDVARCMRRRQRSYFCRRSHQISRMPSAST